MFRLQEGDGAESAAGRRQLRRTGPQLPQLETAGAVPVLRAHPPSAGRRIARLAALGAQDHRRSRPHLLPALHGARPHHRLHRAEPDRRTASTSRAWTWNCWSRWPAMSAIAIENATLYRSLQRKVEEYERLKEFSENIVESINVGILAADLEDRVESWNTQIEQLTGITREQALGQKLSELFPAALVRAVRPRARRDRHPPHLQIRAASRRRAAVAQRQRQRQRQRTRPRAG